MGGTSRQLAATEASSLSLPAGTWALTLSKAEIDGAARDKKHVRFDEGFSITLYLEEMPGVFGNTEPPTPDNASSKVDKKSWRQDKAYRSSYSVGEVRRPMYKERDDYERDCLQREIKGYIRLTFEEWLLSEGSSRSNSNPPVGSLLLAKGLSTDGHDKARRFGPDADSPTASAGSFLRRHARSSGIPTVSLPSTPVCACTFGHLHALHVCD